MTLTMSAKMRKMTNEEGRYFTASKVDLHKLLHRMTPTGAGDPPGDPGAGFLLLPGLLVDVKMTRLKTLPALPSLLLIPDDLADILLVCFSGRFI